MMGKKIRMGGYFMYATIVQQRVNDYETWRKEFDSMKVLRTSSGAYGDMVYRDNSDPNKLTIILKWNSLANAQKYFNSPELKAAMNRGGAGGTEVEFVNEA
jgi:heme-degrading monooxygenase HmoA